MTRIQKIMKAGSWTVMSTLLLSINIFLFSCGSPKAEADYAEGSSDVISAPEASHYEKTSNYSYLLGIYHGVQEGYFLKNQFGDDMVINGRKISVPATDHKFLIKEDGTVSLQQINLEDQSRVYYQGTWKILVETNEILKVNCEVSDGESSNPSYLLVIDKSNLRARCIGKSQPEFELQKRDPESGNSYEQTNSGAGSVQEVPVDGTYFYRDNSVQIIVNISGETWTGVTKIISGFGEDYDDQNSEIENGIVNGKDLYDASGAVRIGFINDGRLNTSIGGQSVTLNRR